MPPNAPQTPLESLRRLLATGEPPELGPGPRPSVWPLEKLNRDLTESLTSAAPAQKEPIRAAIYLWHDHLDESHRIAQDLPGTDGSYLHGIMHRREPDYSNAKYWFHRVGKHPCFRELATRAAAILDSNAGVSLRAELIRNDAWDPFAFIDACERFAARSEPETAMLRAIQAAEFELLLERFCRV